MYIRTCVSPPPSCQWQSASKYHIICPQVTSSPNSPNCLVHLAVRGVVLPRVEAKDWRGFWPQRPVAVSTWQAQYTESPVFEKLGTIWHQIWYIYINVTLGFRFIRSTLSWLTSCTSDANLCHPPLMLWEWTVMRCPSLPGSRPSGSQGADVMGRWIETPTKMEISSLCSMLVSEMDRWMDEGIEVDSDMMS